MKFLPAMNPIPSGKTLVDWIALAGCLAMTAWLPIQAAEAVTNPPDQPFGARDFRPGALWLDNQGVHINAHGGGMLVHGKTYYWFGEHKIDGDAGNYAQVGVHCYSSTDLYNWKDAGIALKVSEDPASEITKGCILERPKVIYNASTKKFVMWFHLELKGQGYKAARTAVAVSDEPAGPYTYVRSLRLNAGQWPENVTEADKVPGPKNFLQRDFAAGQMARDMTLFVDDDGKAYHIAASEDNQTLHIVQLTDDYQSYSPHYVRVFPGKSNEAPALCKHQGKYWLITSGCTGWAPNAARLAVADSLFGPWKELGNPCDGVNPQNHLGQEKTFGGQSTSILPVPGKPDRYIAQFDIWQPKNAIDGRYVWLPITWTETGLKVVWQDRWELNAN